MKMKRRIRLDHRDCVWNCGNSYCPAPTGDYWKDKRIYAINFIKSQPFFK